MFSTIIYTDQTGKFQIQSSHGYKYVIICYTYNCNAILAYLIKKRSASELLQVYQHFYTILHNSGLVPQMRKLENEMSADIEQFIATQNAAVQ